MKIVGCDLHTRYQQIAMLEEETGELVERRLEHESGEARAFYAALSAPVRVGIEATGHTRWFERMLGELRHELWGRNPRLGRRPLCHKFLPMCSFVHWAAYSAMICLPATPKGFTLKH